MLQVQPGADPQRRPGDGLHRRAGGLPALQDRLAGLDEQVRRAGLGLARAHGDGAGACLSSLSLFPVSFLSHVRGRFLRPNLYTLLF